MSDNHFDVIVIGAGGIGSAAVHQLAERGQRALVLEQFGPAHDQGSSHGETRVIRKAYFEHPDYVPLLHEAYDLWKELEAKSGDHLYFETGLVEVGPPDGLIIPGILKAAEEHNLPVETVSGKDFEQRFPALRLPDGNVAVFEREAGFLRVEDCIRTHLRLADAAGATLRFGETLQSWKAAADHVSVTTNLGKYEAQSLVFAAGAWSNPLLTNLGMQLQVQQKQLHWFENRDPALALEADFPCFFYETPAGFFYGFPVLDELGLKVAHHGDGISLDSANQPREVDEADNRQVADFLEAYFPGKTGALVRRKSCLYTMSPDGHFIVDRHPEHRNVSFVAGLSGHGFKFAPVLGKALADLALGESLASEFGFLKCSHARLEHGRTSFEAVTS